MIDEIKLSNFIDYASKLNGYEKGEAHLFLDRLFIAFGNRGVQEAGASLEFQIKIKGKTKFCDLIWPGKVLIEMKKRGENLEKHFTQAKSYWDNSYDKRTEYVVLCNFDEFWVYNWNLQRDPLDKIPIAKLPEMWRSLAFLCPEKVEPIFGNNLVEVTKEAADQIAKLYNSLVNRNIEREQAQRFTLQCLVALFAEDTGLFPEKGFFYNIIDDCIKGQSSYDLFTLLFERMNSKEPATGGRFKGVKYFDGGIFNKINPIELTPSELDLLSDTSKYNWSKVQPSIFGSIFEDSLGKEERHATGAHYTSESDIMRIVEPTVLRPWRERIAGANTLTELNEIASELSEFKVLDPACGSGNFLYISFRELKSLELQLFQKILEKFSSAKPERLRSGIKGSQFYGIDINPLGVELAKITLSMAKKFSADEFNLFTRQYRFFDDVEEPLPFDNLDNNLLVDDALFIDWPKADVIIGNPPFQSKNKMQEEFGPEYVNRVRERFSDVPGRSDYCVYWFRKAHDVLPEGGRAGLVGTNTIRQTNSRVGGLDYILSNDGTIVEAVSTMPWSGEAVVHVSIVNWIKGGKAPKGKRRLAFQYGERKDGPWEVHDLPFIPSSLSPLTDVTGAKILATNKNSGACYQGQTHGHKGFLLTFRERDELIRREPEAEEVTFPYLNADEMLGTVDSQPSRYVVDFQPRDIFSAKKYKNTFEIIERTALPARQYAYNEEKERNEAARANNPKARINRHHEMFYRHWWQLSYGRGELILKLSNINRYIACGQVTKRPIFQFISTCIRPNAALIVFPLDDDYSFGILQSTLHWEWFKARCSTLKGDYRYTSNTVFDSFPWPQWGTLPLDDSDGMEARLRKSPVKIALKVAKAARELRALRNKIRAENNFSLRELYRTLELPGDNPLRTAHKRLDDTVWEAYYYGLPKSMHKKDELEFLLQLNELCARAEDSGDEIIGPGLPSFCKDEDYFFSEDCIIFTRKL
ncbi:DNA methyltransferase [Candidatus Methanocrinis natronophilus]|uniref:site-specific DNA-methyltransferase (adenine-specific) n=1 Tax=Candidatus Methanocrinis natronophilus TaxID=3033396 RepID=A0ABT5X5J6_9EURY|nr:DNA methyltransferase [Candidatus Methanocrinis natronophilus]MDF0589955.1 N-6 DNA methylase [Candidatus Methanocrinis natronophilus]